MRNCVVSMAVKNTGSSTVSGFFGFVQAPPGHALGEDKRVAVAFAEGYQHEFSHAFGLMLDEYIDVRRSFATDRQEPSHLSVFEMWNLSYTGESHRVHWFHLSPVGLSPRGGAARVGQMWKGGRGKEKGVWHPEYKCQMNGGHQNYFSRTDEADQFNASGNQVFASLRSSHFCLWCEEILTVKILEKTDAFLQFQDILEAAGDINVLGRIWYRRWVDALRPVYWTEFNLPGRIADREAYFTNPANLDKGTYFDGDISATNLMKAVRKRHKNRTSMLLWQNY